MALFKGQEKEEVRPILIQERPVAAPQQSPTPNLRRESQLTVIGKNTVIKGNIISSAPIELEGEVKGNIDCKSEVTVSGKLDGDVSANSLIAENAVVNGNITGNATVNLTQNSKIKGNVTAEKVVVSAQINGDVMARELVVLEREATVVGNVTTKFIEIEMGASVEGIITAKSREIKNMNDVAQLEVKDLQKTAVGAAPESPAAVLTAKKDPSPVQ